MKVYCYAQHTSHNGAIVTQTQLDQYDNPDENPDWDLIAEGTEEEIVRDMRERLVSDAALDSNAAFRRRQCRNVLTMFRRPETPARLIDAAAYLERRIIIVVGDEIEREEIDSEQPKKVGSLTGWEPFTEVWEIDGETPEYWIVAK